MLKYLWRNREQPALFTRRWFKTWAKRAWTFRTLVGNELRVRRLRRQGARIGAGTIISPALVSDAQRLCIGENSFIGRVEIRAHAEIRIGSYVCINDRALLLTGGHSLRDPEWRAITAPIEIEDFVWIATGATILAGVKIGRGAVVSACAVVMRDVPAYAVAFGNPAQVIEKARVQTFDYSPVRLIAFQAAWLGGPGKGCGEA